MDFGPKEVTKGNVCYFCSTSFFNTVST